MAKTKPNKADNPNALKFTGNKNTIADKYKMLKAMEVSLCIVSTAIKKVGVNRCTHYDWMDNDKNYAAAINELDNIALDFTESMMFKRIKEGSDQLIKYVMSTKGAKRGYREKTAIELTGKDGGPVEQNNKLIIEILNTGVGISDSEQTIQDAVNKELAG